MQTKHEFLRRTAAVIAAFFTLTFTGCGQTPESPGSLPVSGVVSETTAQSGQETAGVSEGDSFTIHFIDVGQADSALVTCDGHSMLIDGGNADDSNLVYSVLQLSLIHISSEQQDLVRLALDGKNVLCDACIGSGKTSTINVLCNEFDSSKEILYLTYNRLLKLDAQEKILNDNVTVQNLSLIHISRIYNELMGFAARKHEILDIGE